MGKHRKDSRYRRIVVAAVAVGAVGVPSVAMACVDWQDDGGDTSAAARDTSRDWWNDSDLYRAWSTDGGGERSGTPTPSASASKTAGHRHWPKAAKPSQRTRHHTPRATASHPTPKATASTPVAKATASATPTAPSTPKPTATASGVTARIVELVNAERAKAGCSPVTLNATLTKVAQAHSEDMAAHQNMSHTGSDGSSPGDRITRAGYDWSTYGENVAYGYSTADQVMSGWMSSPGHRANILNCSFKEIGVGHAGPGDYWTQDFGATR
ncbi:CAP domain-containing protein [Streptomyces sp. NPDC096152]|uniref:CAP domain-containing protein n=1 Tax=Streptomyces sp. NPDC096152 TaxID=3366078 RepID=UPI003800CE22